MAREAMEIYGERGDMMVVNKDSVLHFLRYAVFLRIILFNISTLFYDTIVICSR